MKRFQVITSKGGLMHKSTTVEQAMAWIEKYHRTMRPLNADRALLVIEML